MSAFPMICREPVSPNGILISEIQRIVAAYFRLRPQDMVSARRDRDIVRPRQIAMYLSKRLTPQSLPSIGKRFGGRDHTTVIHAVRQVELLRHSDANIAHDVHRLEEFFAA